MQTIQVGQLGDLLMVVKISWVEERQVASWLATPTELLAPSMLVR